MDVSFISSHSYGNKTSASHSLFDFSFCSYYMWRSFTQLTRPKGKWYWTSAAWWQTFCGRQTAASAGCWNWCGRCCLAWHSLQSECSSHTDPTTFLKTRHQCLIHCTEYTPIRPRPIHIKHNGPQLGLRPRPRPAASIFVFWAFTRSRLLSSIMGAPVTICVAALMMRHHGDDDYMTSRPISRLSVVQWPWSPRAVYTGWGLRKRRSAKPCRP